MKIRGILLDGDKKPKIVEVEDKLEEYYKLLDCDLIEIIRRRTDSDVYKHLGEINITIITDEEGLLKGRTIVPSAYLINKEGYIEEVLLGKIFVCDEDIDGNLKSLSDEKIATIFKSIRPAGFNNFDDLTDDYGNTLLSGPNALYYGVAEY